MEKNELYPIFLKVSELKTLIIGGGNVGLEKLKFLLKSSPNAKVTIVSIDFKQELIDLARGYQVEFIKDSYQPIFLQECHLVIAATDNIDVNIQVYKDCKSRNILVNVADNPPYCDFYMGGIVTKGNVKLAISTNGKSPTTAKRLRQFFEEVIPEDIDDLVKNLNIFRKTIKGDFEDKVTALNDLTKGLIKPKNKS